jgi:hypothetical protein
MSSWVEIGNTNSLAQEPPIGTLVTTDRRLLYVRSGPR